MNPTRIMWAIAFAVTMPTLLTFVFTAIRNAKSNPHREMTDQSFVVKLPRMVAGIGLVGIVVFVGVGIILVLYWSGKANYKSFIVLYVVFGFFLLLFIYLALKGLIFRVIISGNRIVVYDIFRLPRRFTFGEIDSAEVIVTGGQISPEQLVIRTSAGKKIVVEGMAVEYDRLVKRIKAEVPSERLEGYF